jgi:hypothetical protein
MASREEREVELRELLHTQEGLMQIMELYRQKTVAPGGSATLGRIGLLASQMIPRILDAEFKGTIGV